MQSLYRAPTTLLSRTDLSISTNMVARFGTCEDSPSKPKKVFMWILMTVLISVIKNGILRFQKKEQAMYFSGFVRYMGIGIASMRFQEVESKKILQHRYWAIAITPQMIFFMILLAVYQNIVKKESLFAKTRFFHDILQLYSQMHHLLHI